MRKTAIHTKKYNKFKGVDFSTDPALVDDSRSPMAVNMVSDMGGMPEKRPGWRSLSSLGGRINGLFGAVFDGSRHMLAHAGEGLYRWYEDGRAAEALMGSLPDGRSMAVFMAGCLWIFTGEVLIKYDGVSAVPASYGAYVPLTVISRSPSAGGGIPYEPLNLLSDRQTVGFLADGSAHYYLPSAGISDVTVTVNGAVLPPEAYQVDPYAGIVSFASPPQAPAAGAEDNVFISFSKTAPGGADRINKCRTAAVWGGGGSFDRIIAAGNPDFPNMDFTSGFSDGSYWPDTGYQLAGTDETAIMGYRRLGEHLAIIKQDNGQDSTVFLRSGVLSENGEAVFSTKPCLSGAGAVSLFGFGNIDDEQLILTGAGVYALTTNSLTAERIAQNRSCRIDPLLTAEKLSEAVCVSFDHCFMIFIGGRVYGLDGKQQKSYMSGSDSGGVYECFYWENVPARSVMTTAEDGKESLYFGTDDGRICRFSTDMNDMGRYSDDGEPITAIWATKFDDDGDPMVLKTLLKKGNAVTLKPYLRSSAKICLRTDKDPVDWPAAMGTMDIFNWANAAHGTMDFFSWEDIDFARFTFNTSEAPSEIPFKSRVKNYKRLQFVIKNDAANEGFGIYGVTKHFVIGNFARK